MNLNVTFAFNRKDLLEIWKWWTGPSESLMVLHPCVFPPSRCNVSVISTLLTSSNKKCDLLRCASDPSAKDEIFYNHLLMSDYSKNKASGLTVPRRGVYTPLPQQNRRPFNKGIPWPFHLEGLLRGVSKLSFFYRSHNTSVLLALLWLHNLEERTCLSEKDQTYSKVAQKAL